MWRQTPPSFFVVSATSHFDMLAPVSDDWSPHAWGRFQLLRRIGLGWHAEVFAARDEDGALCCVKRFTPALSESYGRDVVRELRVRLELSPAPQTPGWARVDEFGWVGDTLFVRMELIDGIELRRLIGAEPLSAAAVAHIAVSALAAVRDWQSERRALVARDGSGRARVLRAHGELSGAHVLCDRTGRVVALPICATPWLHRPGNRWCRGPLSVYRGEYGHWSPERLRTDLYRGSDTDWSSEERHIDVHAVGVLAFHALTGRHPFKRSNAFVTLRAIRDDDRVPLASLAPSRPASLVRAIESLLAGPAGDGSTAGSAQAALADWPSEHRGGRDGRAEVAARVAAKCPRRADSL